MKHLFKYVIILGLALASACQAMADDVKNYDNQPLDLDAGLEFMGGLYPYFAFGRKLPESPWHVTGRVSYLVQLGYLSLDMNRPNYFANGYGVYAGVSGFKAWAFSGTGIQGGVDIPNPESRSYLRFGLAYTHITRTGKQWWTPMPVVAIGFRL